MYPSLPDDALHLLFCLCDQYRSNIEQGFTSVNAKRIRIDNLENNLMLINLLKDAGAIKSIDANHYVVLSPAAFSLEQYFKDCAQNHTERKRQQRFQNKVSVASVLVPFITFILGLIVEHFGNIVGSLFSLFK